MIVDQIIQCCCGVGFIVYDFVLFVGGYMFIVLQIVDGNVYFVGIDGEVVYQWKMFVCFGCYVVIFLNGNFGYNGNYLYFELCYVLWLMWYGGDFYEVML